MCGTHLLAALTRNMKHIYMMVCVAVTPRAPSPSPRRRGNVIKYLMRLIIKCLWRILGISIKWTRTGSRRHIATLFYIYATTRVLIQYKNAMWSKRKNKFTAHNIQAKWENVFYSVVCIFCKIFNTLVTIWYIYVFLCVLFCEFT